MKTRCETVLFSVQTSWQLLHYLATYIVNSLFCEYKMRPKCVNLFPTETKKPPCISFLLCPFTLPAPNSPPMSSSFSNYSPLHFAWPCTQACKTESPRGPRFESGCLQGGGDYSNCHTVYTSVQRKRDSVQNVSHIEKELDGRIPVWPKELELANYGPKNCNQRLEEERSATSSVS